MIRKMTKTMKSLGNWILVVTVALSAFFLGYYYPKIKQTIVGEQKSFLVPKTSSEITVSVTDGGGVVSSSVFTLTVTAVNHPPVAGTVTIVRPLNTSTKVLISTILASCSDVDGNTLSLSGVSSLSYRVRKSPKTPPTFTTPRSPTRTPRTTSRR